MTVMLNKNLKHPANLMHYIAPCRFSSVKGFINAVKYGEVKLGLDKINVHWKINFQRLK